MKIDLLVYVKRQLGIFCEKCLEWIEYLRQAFIKEKKIKRRLLEVYSIKKKYMEEEYIKEFIEERKKSIERNKYSISVDNSYISDINDEIGTVTLYCRGKLVDRAILTAGSSTENGNRLIYWNFKK